MKKYSKYNRLLIGILSTGILLASCSKEKFAEFNTDPDAVQTISVEPLFARALTYIHDADFEAFYDNYSYLSRWSRTYLQRTGNPTNFTEVASNSNTRYGRFYNDIGPLLVDIQKTIDKMPDDQKPRYAHMRAIPSILKVYYAWYVSDVNGSLAYTEAFQARYGGTLKPKYETQDQLYKIFDQELKDAVNILKAQQPVEQASYGNSDQYFKGDAKKWVKAANSLRLKIALRLSKRDVSRMTAIVQEVLADNGGLIDNDGEEWVFNAGSQFTSGGNWNITGNGRAFVGEHGVVDYMWNNTDPRIRFFFVKNQWTQENFNLAKAQGVIPASAVWNPRQYYGQYSSPASATDPTKARFFNPLQIKSGTTTITLDTVSRIQDRLFQPENNGGTGLGVMPIITYADVCFMRAELAQRGITSESAEQWYYKGIESSLKFYDKISAKAIIYNYQALTQAEIDAYKNAPDVKFNSSKGLEQIVMQSYLNYFKNYNEAWALVKRTNMPNQNTAIVFEQLKRDNENLEMPRRFVINYPLAGDYNFDNKKAAVEEMEKDPDFGEPTSIAGRVWWDKK